MDHLGICEYCLRGAGTEVISAHPTSLGRVVYARCACGRVRMCLIPYVTDHPTVLGSVRPTSAGSTR